MLFQMYILSPDDLPYFNANSYDLKRSDTDIEVLIHVSFTCCSNYLLQTLHFQTVETRNGPDVQDLNILQRGCRFPSEFIEYMNMPYSVSNCFEGLRIQAELQFCNCTINTGPPKCLLLIAMVYQNPTSMIFSPVK